MSCYKTADEIGAIVVAYKNIYDIKTLFDVGKQTRCYNMSF